jgi:hypothetical protein
LKVSNRKVNKLAQNSLKSWAHICAHRGKAVMVNGTTQIVKACPSSQWGSNQVYWDGYRWGLLSGKKCCIGSGSAVPTTFATGIFEGIDIG